MPWLYSHGHPPIRHFLHWVRPRDSDSYVRTCIIAAFLDRGVAAIDASVFLQSLADTIPADVADLFLLQSRTISYRRHRVILHLRFVLPESYVDPAPAA